MWTNEEINRLKSQHGHGWSVEESADILERSPLDVRNKLIALGLKPMEYDENPVNTKSRKKRQTISADIKAKIIQLRSQGYDYKYIGEQTNTSKATIARILQKSGKTDVKKKECGNNELAKKCAELEKRILDAETVINNQAEMISDKNNELYKALKEIEALKASENSTGKYDNSWILAQVKEVRELLKRTKNDNAGREIGYVIGRLDMLIEITEKGLGF